MLRRRPYLRDREVCGGGSFPRGYVAMSQCTIKYREREAGGRAHANAPSGNDIDHHDTWERERASDRAGVVGMLDGGAGRDGVGRTTTQVHVPRDAGRNPLLHLVAEAHICVRGTRLGHDVCAAGGRVISTHGSDTGGQQGTHRGTSVACAGSSMPMTAASSRSGCCMSTASSSAGGTACRTSDIHPRARGASHGPWNPCG